MPMKILLLCSTHHGNIEQIVVNYYCNISANLTYTYRCGHCKRLKPEYAKAAGDLKGSDPPIALVKVDCTEAGKDTCTKYGVSGYPTLKIFSRSDVVSDYNGPREAAGIVKYMQVHENLIFF